MLHASHSMHLAIWILFYKSHTMCLMLFHINYETQFTQTNNLTNLPTNHLTNWLTNHPLDIVTDRAAIAGICSCNLLIHFWYQFSEFTFYTAYSIVPLLQNTGKQNWHKWGSINITIQGSGNYVPVYQVLNNSQSLQPCRNY